MSCLEGVGQLKTLTLGNNKIDAIPEEIIKLVNLEIFDLSNNGLTMYVILHISLLCIEEAFTERH